MKKQWILIMLTALTLLSLLVPVSSFASNESPFNNVVSLEEAQ